MTGADIITVLKKHPISTACGVICILCGAALYVRGDKVADNKKAFEEKSTEAQKIATNVRNAANLPQQVAAMQDAAKQLDSRLVRASQLAINQQYFYRLENETGVKLLEVRPGTLSQVRSGAAKGAYSPVPFTVNIEGNFKQVFDFIQRLEKGRHFCRFVNISFNKSSGQEATERLSVNMTLELLGTP